MILYYIILLLSTILLYFSRIEVYENNGKTKQKILIVLALLVLVIPAGFRWNVGTDFEMYNLFFEKYKSRFVLDLQIEPMFKLFCFLPGQIFNTSLVTFILIAVYTYGLVFKFCKKNCKFYELAMFLYLCMGFYFSSLNIVRQWMAIPAMLLSYNYISEKKYYKAILFFLLSYLCHYTSILLLPIIFFLTVIKKEKTRILILLLSIFIFLFSNKIISIIQMFLLEISFLSKYAYYFSKANSMNASFILPAICLIIYVYYLLFYKVTISKDKKIIEEFDNKIKIYVNVLIFAFMFTLLGTRIDIFERMSHYFFPIVIVIIPMIIEKLKITNNKKIIFCAVLLLGLAFFTNTMLNNGGDILPYRTVIGVRK